MTSGNEARDRLTYLYVFRRCKCPWVAVMAFHKVHTVPIMYVRIHWNKHKEECINYRMEYQLSHSNFSYLEIFLKPVANTLRIKTKSVEIYFWRIFSCIHQLHLFNFKAYMFEVRIWSEISFQLWERYALNFWSEELKHTELSLNSKHRNTNGCINSCFYSG